MHPAERLVVIGNGMAGMRTVEELLSRAPVPLPHHRVRRRAARQLQPHHAVLRAGGRQDGRRHRHQLPRLVRRERHHAGHRRRGHARSIRRRRTVTLAGGRDAALRQAADRHRLEAAGAADPGAGPARRLRLSRHRRCRARCWPRRGTQRRAVVIGGGLLGLEAAWGLKQRGMSVALVHLMPTLMERQLDAAAGQIAAARPRPPRHRLLHRRADRGNHSAPSAPKACSSPMAASSRPIWWCWRSASGPISTWRAPPSWKSIAASWSATTCAPAIRDIFAVGECVEHRGQVFGLVAPIWDQAKVCAARLAGDEEAVYVPPPVFTSLKITGVDVFSAGALMAADEGDDEITLRDDKRGLYKKIVLRDDKLVGAVLYGDVADGQWYLQLMRDKTDMSALCATGWCSAAPLPSRPARRPPAHRCRRHARRRRRSAAATASPRARSSRHRGQEPDLARRRCAPTPRRRPPAASAPARSKRSWRIRGGAVAQARRTADLRMHRCRP